MKSTLSVIKADIGSIGGHIQPSKALVEEVKSYILNNNKGIASDYFICHTGDDIAILFAHDRGVLNSDIHQLAWKAFKAGTEVAKKQGFSGAAMLPYDELEYGGIVDRLKKIEPRFKMRKS